MKVHKNIIAKLTEILNTRSTQHGSFEDNSLNYVAMKAALSKKEDIEPLDTMAIDMILVKLSRLKSNPKNEDHWLDIIGYAVLRLNALLDEKDT